MLLIESTTLFPGLPFDAQNPCIDYRSTHVLAAIPAAVFSTTGAAPCLYSYLAVQGGNA